MRLWGWWKKSVESEKKPEPPKRPAPKTEVLIYLKDPPSHWLEHWTLWYDLELDEQPAWYGTVIDGWVQWPTDRDGERIRVPTGNILFVCVRPYKPGNVY